MLRSHQLRTLAPPRFVCWQCLARTYHGKSSDGLLRAEATSRPAFSIPRKNGLKVSRRSFTTSPINSATVESRLRDPPRDEPPPIEKIRARANIRAHLKQWQEENASSFTRISTHGGENIKRGDVINNLTRPQGGDFQVDFEEEQSSDLNGTGPMPIFDKNELVDVGNRRTFLLPGDLVELTSVGSRQQEIAIYVRELEKQSQFYTMTGRYVHRQAKAAKFYVPEFVEKGELEDILPWLPDSDIASSLEDRLQTFPNDVPRNIGKPLLKKMAAFWQQSETAYQTAASRLDNAHNHVADATRFKYATLDQIADQLLSTFTPKGDNGKFPTPMLYAVHRAMLRDDIGFRAQSQGTLRAGGQYEITPLHEVNAVTRVTAQVRKYRDDKLEGRRTSSLYGFIAKARRLIDMSRKHRDFTIHGTLGPSSMKSEDKEQFRYGKVVDTFGHNDRDFVWFMESWACLESFGAQSALNGIGSTILRATNRYQGIDLDRTTAWTFLQEIGSMPPWENKAAFELRLPSAGRRLDFEKNVIEGDYIPDTLKDLRRSWGDLPVFCVDDITAHEIDDGFSIEPTETPDEYWVHVHAADPAAHIDPNGKTAALAEQLTETVYMPERVVPMLDSEFVQANLSLAPWRPCLTFSARMNLNGDLLENNITASRVQNVVFLTPDVLSQLTTGPSQTKEITRTVGPEVSALSPNRPMLELDQLSDKHKEDLMILHKIAAARTEQLRVRGGITSGPLSPSVFVSFNRAPWEGPKTHKSCHHYYGDPTIKIVTQEKKTEMLATTKSQVSTVGRLMLLAGEVAAQWSHSRGIPIPFRVTPRNLGKENPSDFFNRMVLPQIEADGNFPLDVTMEYLSLMGQVQPSTTAGPHVAVGVDMLAKATSPLRRYGDLLSHWQIEAAFLEEARLGQVLLGNTRDDFLPFTKARMDSLLPRLDTRERLINRGKREADRGWMCHFLLRAWRYKEIAIPSSFEFVVRSTNAESQTVGGIIPAFLVGAQFNIPTWTTVEDVKLEDRFEVAFEDINVYNRKIITKALRRLESWEDL